nr:uncharacterized protein DDB_G0284459-like [Equus asinus]
MSRGTCSGDGSRNNETAPPASAPAMRHPPRPQLPPPPPRRAKETGQQTLRPVWRDSPSRAGRGRDRRWREGANRLRDRDDGQQAAPTERKRDEILLGRLEDRDIQGRRPFEDRGRNQNNAATSQGTPGASRSWKRQACILEALEGAWPCQHSDFLHLVSKCVKE